MLTANRSHGSCEKCPGDSEESKGAMCIGMRAGSNLQKMREDKSREAEVSGNLQNCYNVT